MSSRRPPNSNHPRKYDYKPVDMVEDESDSAIDVRVHMESDNERYWSTNIGRANEASPAEEGISSTERLLSTKSTQATGSKRKLADFEGEGYDSVEVGDPFERLMSTLAKKTRVTTDNKCQPARFAEDEGAVKFPGTQSQRNRPRGVKKPNMLQSNDIEASGSSVALLPPYPGLRFHFPWIKLKAETLRVVVSKTLGIAYVGDKKRAIMRLNQVQTDGLAKAIKAEEEYKHQNPINSAKTRREKGTEEEPPMNIRRSKRKRTSRRESLEQMLAVEDDDGGSDDHSASGSAVESVFAPAQLERGAAGDPANTQRSQREPVVARPRFQEIPAVTGGTTPDDLSYSAWSPLSKPPPHVGNNMRSVESFVPLSPVKPGNSYQSIMLEGTSPSYSIKRAMSPRSSFVSSYFSLPQLPSDDAIPSHNMFGHIAGGYDTAHSSTWTNSGLSEAVVSKNKFDDIVELLPSIIEAPRDSKEYNTLASAVLYEVLVNSDMGMAINAATPDMKKEMIRLMLQNRKPPMPLIEA
ncbi:hypothetical protein BDZ89DRAFT_1051507 [Hymenopellis radicata]|nr:hypothetical protein BDZ89DRAFT_1051507 [Hymenopellis radicata]